MSSKLVLPAPDEPSTATRWPGDTEHVTFLRICLGLFPPASGFWRTCFSVRDLAGMVYESWSRERVTGTEPFFQPREHRDCWDWLRPPACKKLDTLVSLAVDAEAKDSSPSSSSEGFGGSRGAESGW
jgi:hypothetical protein